jgi:uncharacterized protein (TIGR00290 family)
MCWSSGKDSAWALHVVRRCAEVEVVGLLTTITAPYQRVAMHGVRDEVLAAQAAALGLPLHRVPIPAPCSNEEYQRAMAAALDTAKSQGVTRMIFGDLFLEDVRAYRERQLANTGVEPMFPLWNLPTAALAEEMIASGVVAYVTCVDTSKLPATLAGRVFDRRFLAELPEGADPCAERGEFHSCVTAGPMFARPIPVEVGETVLRDGFAFADLRLSGVATESQAPAT